MANQPRLSESRTRELVARAQSSPVGSARRRKAETLLLEANEGLVTDIATGRMAVRGVRVRTPEAKGLEVDDLIQAGYLGVLDAIDTFDLECGVKFSTHASYRILGAVTREITKARLMNRESDQPEPFTTLAEPPHEESAAADRMFQLPDGRRFRLKDLAQQFPGHLRQMVALRYGLGGHVPHGLKEISAALGVPTRQVQAALREGLEAFRGGCSGA